MVKRTASLLVFLSAFGPLCAGAQGTSPRFGIGLGRTIPVGSFHQDANGEGFTGGWSATAQVNLKTPSRRLGLRIDAGFSRHGANDQLKADLTSALGRSADETITLIGTDASVTYPLARGARVGTSVFGGVGLWHVTVGVSTSNATRHTSAFKPAWQLGGQLTYRRVFLELRYVAVSAVKGLHRTVFFPMNVGMRFGR